MFNTAEGQSAPRAVSDAEHDNNVGFFLGYEEGQTLPSRQRRWLAAFSFVDFGAAKNLIKRGTEMELVKYILWMNYI